MGLGSEIRNSGSGKNLFRVLDPGTKRHRIRIRNTEKTEEPLPVEDAECTEQDEGGEEARRTPRILFIQPPDIRIRHVHAAQFQLVIQYL
jgi:hypothetical protein